MKSDFKNILKVNGLKITPQRIAVLEEISRSTNHPTAEMIIKNIRGKYSNIAIGTIYQILDTFCEKGITRRVKTEKDGMRYDSITPKHHHLYCIESDRIADYFDDEINDLLKEYFKKKKIPDFKVENISLQIQGIFLNSKEE